MPQLFDPDLQLVLESKFLYVPLLFDPVVKRELLETFHRDPSRKKPAQSRTDVLVKKGGRYFVKALNVYSLLENYEKIYAASYEQVKNACVKKYRYEPGLNETVVGENLRTILFHIMPHFMKKDNRLEREKLSEEHVLDMIKRKVDIPKDFSAYLEKLFLLEPLRTLLSRLDKETPKVNVPIDGLISGGELREWLRRELEIRILDTEKHRIKEQIRVREQFIQTEKNTSQYFCILQKKDPWN